MDFDAHGGGVHVHAGSWLAPRTRATPLLVPRYVTGAPAPPAPCPGGVFLGGRLGAGRSGRGAEQFTARIEARLEDGHTVTARLLLNLHGLRDPSVDVTLARAEQAPDSHDCVRTSHGSSGELAPLDQFWCRQRQFLSSSGHGPCS